jgi:hypothetical protein
MKRPPQQKGNKFEKKIVKQISSGALWWAPLDISTDEYLIEAKYTDQKGYRVSKDLLEKIWNSALKRGKLPILVIGIKRDDETIFTLNCQLQVTKKV